jgi:hypothetical protein
MPETMNRSLPSSRSNRVAASAPPEKEPNDGPDE